jgi:hypothetical protein
MGEATVVLSPNSPPCTKTPASSASGLSNHINDVLPNELGAHMRTDLHGIVERAADTVCEQATAPSPEVAGATTGADELMEEYGGAER